MRADRRATTRDQLPTAIARARALPPPTTDSDAMTFLADLLAVCGDAETRWHDPVTLAVWAVQAQAAGQEIGTGVAATHVPPPAEVVTLSRAGCAWLAAFSAALERLTTEEPPS